MSEENRVPAAVLRTEGVKKHFGGLKAVDGVDLAVRQGEVLGLIGPNGAGKTTLFNVICGVYTPTEGRIFLGGREIQGMPAHEAARLGIARTFQITRIFKDMTVLENVLTAIGLHRFTGVAGALRTSHTRANLAAAENYLAMVELEGLASMRAGHLSLGSMRRLEIARSLALEPVLLMLDEPCAGLGAEATEEFIRLILRLKSENMTTMIVEHNMAVATAVCDRMVVLNYGQKIAEGAPAVVQSDPAVIEAYLGREDEAAC